jgi:hypothetical protein
VLDPEAQVTLVRQLVERAESSLRDAAFLLKLGPECPADEVCWHAHGCAESYLKALIAAAGMDVPRTNDLTRLMDILPAKLRPDLSTREQQTLTSYAGLMTGKRGDIPLLEAQHAHAAARAVQRDAWRRLPPEVRGDKKS